jgi:hypothetical protein
MRDLQVAAGYNANDKDNNFDYIILLSPMWWPRNKKRPTVIHACRKRRLKCVATLPLGDINTKAWSSGWGLGVGLKTLTCKKENCWEVSKKFSRILWRRPRPKLGCGANERRIICYIEHELVLGSRCPAASDKLCLCWVTGWMIGVLGFDSQRGAGNFSLHHRVQNGSGAHSASYLMGNRGSFLGGKAAWTWSWPPTSI